MLRDAKTTPIAERMRRPPLGGDIVLRCQRQRRTNGFFSVRIHIFVLSHEFILRLSLGGLVRLKETLRKFAALQPDRKLVCYCIIQNQPRFSACPSFEVLRQENPLVSCCANRSIGGFKQKSLRKVKPSQESPSYGLPEAQ